MPADLGMIVISIMKEFSVLKLPSTLWGWKVGTAGLSLALSRSLHLHTAHCLTPALSKRLLRSPVSPPHFWPQPALRKLAVSSELWSMPPNGFTKELPWRQPSAGSQGLWEVPGGSCPGTEGGS